MCFYFGKNAFSALRSPWVPKVCVAANGAMRFSVRSFGCALFYFMQKEGIEMNRVVFLTMAFALLLLLTACGSSPVKTDSAKETSSTIQETNELQLTGYPKIEEISWEFRNTVRYGEPVAVFDYTNNSNYTIVLLDFQYEMKDGVTSEQLQLTDILTDSLVPDEEIPEMTPNVLDWIVCDPGEKAEGAICYMKYNTEPANTNQCQLMNLKSADIYFIGEDGKRHTVSYSAENGGYSLWETSEELYSWIDNDYTKMIPKPDTRIASADQFKEDCLGVKAYDMSHDAYLAYIDACEDMEFENKYPNEDHDYSFTGTNPEGYEIYVRYIDYMHCIEITLKKI
ncbi:MAG: DUF6591 domain-containing protein [Candidatus Faecousia sp.]|nr:hypothetical protein [Bacillota bacterium]MDY4219017.1 DUF6591 domain-containing protein [Candidatus Faecousia sp.]